MLCYQCGSYNHPPASICSACGEPLRKPASVPRRRSTKSKVFAPLKPGDRLGDRYEILRSLARGAAGWVYRVRDLAGSGEVALKVIDSSLLTHKKERRHFVSTALRACEVRHPNLARVLSAVPHAKGKGSIYYTMEAYDGPTLRTLLDRRVAAGERFALSELVPLVAQINEALNELDGYGAHGSIRPASVLLLPDRVKITGLPHAQGLPPEPFVREVTRQGGGGYLAPEVASATTRALKSADRRTDVYGLATLCAELLSGHSTPSEFLRWAEARAEQKKSWGSITQVLKRCWSAEKKNRPASPQTIYDAVAEAAIYEEEEGPELADPGPLSSDSGPLRPVQMGDSRVRVGLPPGSDGSAEDSAEDDGGSESLSARGSTGSRSRRWSRAALIFALAAVLGAVGTQWGWWAKPDLGWAQDWVQSLLSNRIDR